MRTVPGPRMDLHSGPACRAGAQWGLLAPTGDRRSGVRAASFRTIPALFLALSLAGCGALHPGGSLANAPRYGWAFDLALQVETQVEDGAGQRVPTPSLPPETARWTGTLTRKAARRYRDDSIGHLVQLQDVTVSSSGAAPTPSDLAGRSLELRTFDDGEILDIRMADHVAGPPRWGDLLLPLWAAISPTVPRILPGETASRTFAVPFLVDRSRGARVTVRTTWTYLGVDKSPMDLRGHHFSWTGVVEGRGMDRGQDWVAQSLLDGQAQGQVWLATRDLAVLEHTFRWDMRTTLQRRTPPQAEAPAWTRAQEAPSGEEVPAWGRLVQHQILEGSVRAVETGP